MRYMLTYIYIANVVSALTKCLSVKLFTCMFQSPTMFNYHGGDQEFLESALAAFTDHKNMRRNIKLRPGLFPVLSFQRFQTSVQSIGNILSLNISFIYMMLEHNTKKY